MADNFGGVYFPGERESAAGATHHALFQDRGRGDLVRDILDSVLQDCENDEVRNKTDNLRGCF